MQIINPSPNAVYKGMVEGTMRIATGEGVLKLWRGMSSVVVGAGKSPMLLLLSSSSTIWTCPVSMLTAPGPAHAVYFATYEAVKHAMGGNRAGVHHPLAAGK